MDKYKVANKSFPKVMSLLPSEGFWRWVTIMLLVIVTGCEKPKMHISSSEVYAPLLEAWVESFGDTNAEMSIDVKNQTQKSGIQSLLKGKTDLRMTHIPLNATERAAAQESGMTLVKLMMARDGSVLIVQASSIIERLKLEDIQNIFSGVYDRRDIFSQRMGSLKLFADRQDKVRNTYFKETVLKDNDWSSEIVWVNSQESVMDSIKENRDAIGLVGLSSPMTELNDIKILSITTEDEVISPTKGYYPLGYSILFYYDRKHSPKVNEFVRYCASKKGQGIALQKGAYPVL